MIVINFRHFFHDNEFDIFCIFFIVFYLRKDNYYWYKLRWYVYRSRSRGIQSGVKEYEAGVERNTKQGIGESPRVSEGRWVRWRDVARDILLQIIIDISPSCTFPSSATNQLTCDLYCIYEAKWVLLLREGHTRGK